MMLDNNQYTNAPLYGPVRILTDTGLSIIPVGTDKRPQVKWQRYQERAAGAGELEHWFVPNDTPSAPALAVVCGAVSGGLTVLDFDTDSAGTSWYDGWAAMVGVRAPGLRDRLPHVTTPSGGWHVYLRADQCDGNQELAKTAAGAVRIETRGEGGYVVAPPSPGYHTARGTLRVIPAVTEGEYRILLQCARALSEAPTTAARLMEQRLAPAAGARPGDAYNARATLLEVADLLCRHGWTAGAAHADKIPLTRPGKSPREGTSGDVAVVQGIPVFTQFSSNGGPFEPGRGYSAFAVYAILEHGGDYAAAARGVGGTAYAPIAPRATNCTQQQQTATQEQGQPAPSFDWRQHVRPLTELMTKEFPPATFVVPGVIPSGATLIVGAPKTGKSLLGWQIALAKALGGKALGKIDVERADVLYLLLEDGERLVQKRVRRMLRDTPVPSNFAYSVNWAPVSEGGVEALRDYLGAHPTTRLIVIDTFEPFRAMDKPGQNAYRNDYAGLRPVTQLAHETGVDIIVVHHTAKMERPDVFATGNGSYGLNGVVDTMAVLTRVRFGPEVILSVTSRDLDEDLQLALQYDPLTCCHTVLGNAEEIGQTRLQRLVLAALRRTGEGMDLGEIADELGRAKDTALRMLLLRMKRAGLVRLLARGRYAATPKGSTEEEEGEDVTCNIVTFDKGGAAAGVAVVSDNVTSDNVTFEDREMNRGAPVVAIGQSACSGCGRGWTARPAPYDAELAICSRCGTELGSWPDLQQ